MFFSNTHASVLLILLNKGSIETAPVMQSQGTHAHFWACWHIDLLQAEAAWFAPLHLSRAHSLAWDQHHSGTKPLKDTCFKGTLIKRKQLVGMRSLSNLWSFLSCVGSQHFRFPLGRKHNYNVRVREKSKGKVLVWQWQEGKKTKVP